MKKFILIIIGITVLSCHQNTETTDSYVIEVTSFQYKPSVSSDKFWEEDSKIQDLYTSKQPGYISRESGYSKDTNEVVVVVRWQTMKDAEASMAKFMGNNSVASYVNMIEGSTMKMSRYLKQ